jgi:hypothetical protein
MRFTALFPIRRQKPAKPLFRPMLEVLEDRWLPSLLVVSNLHDAGRGSLRSAIARANSTDAPDTIEFAPGLTGTIRLTSGELIISEDLTIKGPGAARLAVSGTDISRIFAILQDATVLLSRLTISNGNSGTSAGGGVVNHGRLTVMHTVFTDNSTRGGGQGGAIANVGQLVVKRSRLVNNQADGAGALYNLSSATITHTVISHNQADGFAAGIFNNGGVMSVSNSTISYNTATLAGGGILNSNGNLTLRASTLHGNVARTQFGGGIAHTGSGPVTITNSTIVNNASLGGAGGGGMRAVGAFDLLINSSTITGNIDASGGNTSAGGLSCSLSGGSFVLHNTVVADNFATGGGPPDLRATVATVSQGNFIGIGTTALVGIANGTNGNQIGTSAAPLDPKFGPLQNNGGPTPTRLPRPGSLLINRGVNAVLPFFDLTVDQRGFRRIKGGTVDIGAVEFGATSPGTNQRTSSWDVLAR